MNELSLSEMAAMALIAAATLCSRPSSPDVPKTMETADKFLIWLKNNS